jgi:hypothetical protein
MLTEESKLKWANYFAKQAQELNIPEGQRNIFIQAALFGTHRYSLMLMKRIAKYGDDLMNTDVDGDNWITDASVRMFMQHLEPEEAQANTNDISSSNEPSAP